LLDEGGESNRTFDTQAVGIEGEKSCSKSSSRTNERSTQVEIHMSAHPSVGTAVNAVPNVSISYCTTSRLLLRAAWLAQELISVATEDIASVTLTPIRPPSKEGSLVVSLDGQVVWDLAAQGRFPEVSDLKQLITTRTLL
jgi:selenoprotein W-related protein